ncbi:pyridine nucleotide-disulfide oxidoreductase [Amycolatopsis orientalis]|uniref:Pyridine nucleotide-disulfide oxidoreductase n=1 Tax=Amycolatopsis orientalis TaxID=31958 RepID=A0A193BX41_AMYOR|nr:FAD-dependent oxidoreductase [Amycolatopsis orientalis]ANN16740.1 pyridine nucleotide-disulfide oxidoreductase [Amycolatopsis orientalis]
MTTTVAVIGGGYGGTTVAKELDSFTDVVLVEPREDFVHHVAALRGLVDPEWTDRLFYPYTRLLERGRVLRDHAASVDQSGITLASGERLTPDYTVLATGSAYPFPAKIDFRDSATAKAKIRATREELAGAEKVLLLGAGPVGLELAGEIKAVWPEKAVTIVDPAEGILPGFPDDFRAEIRRQLDELGVELLLGTSLTESPVSEPGQAKTFTAALTSGGEVTADLWFQCFGGAPHTAYLDGDLAAARQANGQVAVTAELRLPGQERVFALGDITALPEGKLAKVAGDHAEVVVANIRALIEGGELRTHTPGAPMISLPLGPSGGATYTVETGILDAATTSEIKGSHMMVSRFEELFNVA